MFVSVQYVGDAIGTVVELFGGGVGGGAPVYGGDAPEGEGAEEEAARHAQQRGAAHLRMRYLYVKGRGLRGLAVRQAYALHVGG